MSENRKNRLVLDGGQDKEDEHISTYKAIPESETDFRKSKSSLAKSREKVSADGAEEKLLVKEDEVKITPRVDMDAKYVVESYTNGDAKIELDANKKQFTGLTKEELMKYADDPFWVRLRWFMFILFWALWLCMLAGAIIVIVKAPKCAPPTPKTWFEKGPLVESSLPIKDLEPHLSILEEAGVAGVFAPLCTDNTYDIPTTCFDELVTFITKAKEHSIKVVIDLTANYVSKTHAWFIASENRTQEYDNYFIWHRGTGIDQVNNRAGLPNNWTSTTDQPVWSWSTIRQEYYLHQYKEEQPDLNFTNPEVVREFDAVVTKLMKAGASGIRLHKARQLLVNSSFENEYPNVGKGSNPDADHTQYEYFRHSYTSDQPGLKDLFLHFSSVVDQNGANPGAGETVFTIAENGKPGAEMFLLGHNMSAMRPISAQPLDLTSFNITRAAELINKRLVNWTALQLTIGSGEVSEQLAAFAMLLPAAPVFQLTQLGNHGNESIVNEAVKHLVPLRSDQSVEHGNYSLQALPTVNGTGYVLACARWKPKHTGYVSVFNPEPVDVVTNLTSLTDTVPETLSVHYSSEPERSLSVERESVHVPPLASVIFSYVPDIKEKAEQ